MRGNEEPIAVIASRVRLEERLIFAAFERRGVPYVHVDPRRLTLMLGDGRPPYRAALIREVSHHRGLSIATVLETMGVRTLNRPEVLAVCGDKLQTALAFQRAGLRIPRTAVAWDERSALEAMDKLGYPVVIKPVTGSWGRLTARAYDHETGQALVEHRSALPNPQQRIFYLQEHIDKPGRDIKAYVAGDTLVCAIYKQSTDGWRTNTAIGGAAVQCPITDELEAIVLAAARAVGGGFLGVDILPDRDGRLYANEVNHTPEFHGAVEATGVDIGDSVVGHVIEQVRSWPKD